MFELKRLALLLICFALVPIWGFGQEPVELLATLRGPVSVIRCVEDGERVLAGSQDGLHLLDRDGGILRTCKLPIQQLTSAVISRDGKTVWVGGGDPGFDGQVVAVDFDSFEIKTKFDLDNDVISALAISPDGIRLVAASIDQGIDVLEWKSGESFKLLGHSKAVTGVDWIDDRLAVSVAEDMSVRVWDANEKQLVRTMNQHVGPVLGVRLLDGAESSRPVVATWGKDRTVRFWQPTIGRMIRFVALDGIPLSVCWNSREGVLLVGDATGLVSGIDWQTGKTVFTKKISDQWIAALSADWDSGQVFAGTSSGELLRFTYSTPNKGQLRGIAPVSRPNSPDGQ